MTGARAHRQNERLERAGARLGLVSRPLTHDGRLRPCLVFAPDAQPQEHRPLLLALHGGAGNPLAMARMTRFHEIAARENFIVAYPGGAGPTLVHATWNAGGAEAQGWAEAAGVDDVGYLRAVIDALAKEFVADRARVYAAGMSKGAMMAYRLAAEASDAIAAIAAVAGPMCAEPAQSPRPVSVVHIHGVRDRNVPFGGGRGAFTRRSAVWPSSEASLAYWRRINRTTNDQASSGPQTERRRATGPGGGDVELILLEKRRHEWPKPEAGLLRRLAGAPPLDGLDASEEIWRFLAGKRLNP